MGNVHCGYKPYLFSTLQFNLIVLLSALITISSAKAQQAPTQAIGVRSFTQSLGVNTHMMNKWNGNAYANVAGVEAQLNYLGIKYLRDCFCDNYGISMLKKLNYDLGIKFNVWVSGVNYATSMAAAKANPYILDGMEGANEADNFPQSFLGLTSVPAGVAEQKQLYPDTRFFTKISGLKINSLTVIKNENIPLVGNLSSYTDRVSSHIYPQWGGYYGELPYPYIQLVTQRMGAMAPGKPAIITEGGWWTKPHIWGVTETVQAKYTLNYLFDAFKQGVARTYLYELLDEYSDPLGLDREQHFGLFRYDGSAKPVAVALHNLTTLLGDVGNVTVPGTLTYSVTGMPATGYQLLMQKSDGTFVLALWNDARLWDNGLFKERSVASVQVLLGLGQQADKIDIYDPLVGTTPLQTNTNIGGLTLMLPDHPILIFIKPATASPTVVAADAKTTILQNAVPSLTASIGKSFSITYAWQAASMGNAYKAFVHFVDAAGNLLWQDDYWPPVSTSSWSGSVNVTHNVVVPATVPAGTYRVISGLFDPAPPYSGQALVKGAGVSDMGANRYQVGVVNVTP